MNIPFIGREKQIAQLNQLLHKKTPSLVVIKGRRRIGKSRLIEEFGKGKNFIRFSGLPPTEDLNEQDERDVFSRQFADNGLPQPRADDWGNMFKFLADLTKTGRYIIFFDEISWMGAKDPTFLGKLKNAWDMYFHQNPQMILILCGSVSTWIESNIIQSTGFFGRISLKITLDDLSFIDSAKLLQALGFRGSVREIVLLLNVMGGIPWYIENIEPNLNAINNIKKLCFQKDGLLVLEFSEIFHQLFGRRLPTCKDIIALLAKQKLSHSQIADALDYSRSGALSEYLDDLTTLGFIHLEKQWNIKTHKYSNINVYSLKDNYLRFYFRCIVPYLNKIQSSTFENINPTSLPGWSSIMGLQFETLVRNNKKLIWDALNLAYESILMEGPFIKKATSHAPGCQIDYMIQTDTNTLYVCEIKFSRNTITKQIISEVQNKIKTLSTPQKFTCLPILIHTTDIDEAVEESGYFYKIIDFGRFLQ